MTIRSQKREAVAELAQGEFESSVAESNQPENLVADPSKLPRIQLENLDEIKTSWRKEILSDLAENQTEMLKLIAPVTKKFSDHHA